MVTSLPPGPRTPYLFTGSAPLQLNKSFVTMQSGVGAAPDYRMVQLPQVEITRSCKDFILTHLRVIPKPTGLTVRLGGMCELTVQFPPCASQGQRTAADW